MHRKKFLSFLGMAVVAAPILAKEFPQTDEVKPLELKDGSLGIGRLGLLSEATDPVFVTGIKGVTATWPIPSEGQILTYNSLGNCWEWKDPTLTKDNILVGNGNNVKSGYTDLFEGFETYHETYTTDWVNFKATPYE